MTTNNNIRFHGPEPYAIVAIHGGPGAPGSAASLARGVAAACGVGVLEPWQTAASIAGETQELCDALERHGAPPVTLIGHSWGAWLSLITAARRPGLVRKLILIGSAPFEERDAAGIMKTRLKRLTEPERREAESLMQILNGTDGSDSATTGEREAGLARFGALMEKTDNFDPLPAEPDEPETKQPTIQPEVYAAVWAEAAALRRSGKLLKLVERIQCPVVAIHGDYDPHPAEGVARPLALALPEFRFHLLKNCGHEPWRERHARNRFFESLAEELAG
jgi:pimeloyl-ACP methyl ester carboxylesterase